MTPRPGSSWPAAEYLSGNVRDKLRVAQQAAQDDPRFAVNVEELGKVIPADLTPAEIGARLGAAWIDTSVVRQFLREILDDPSLKVEHPGGQIWTVKGNRGTVLATSTWGTRRYPAPQLAQAVLEQRRIEVRDKVGDDAWVLNMDETLAAQEKAAELGSGSPNGLGRTPPGPGNWLRPTTRSSTASSCATTTMPSCRCPASPLTSSRAHTRSRP